ncbi:MAG: MarR family winged helix-turn-helix transcriptional regulator [Acidimicrobiales bacterium]
MTTDIAACARDERVVLFALLWETTARLARDLDLEMEARGAVPLAWFEVMLRLEEAPEGHLRMTEVADAIVHSSGGTTRLVDRLEEAGLVARQLCPSDRRAIHVALTDAGRERLAQSKLAHIAFLDSRLAQRLDAAERAQLLQLLGALNAG